MMMQHDRKFRSLSVRKLMSGFAIRSCRPDQSDEGDEEQH
jgi:hypothetical protein